MFEAIFGNTDTVDFLTSKGVDVNAVDMYGKTALKLAADVGREFTALLMKQ